MKRRHCHHVLMMSLVLLLLVTGGRRSQPLARLPHRLPRRATTLPSTAWTT